MRDACRKIVFQNGGDPEKIWNDEASPEEMNDRIARDAIYYPGIFQEFSSFEKTDQKRYYLRLKKGKVFLGWMAPKGIPEQPGIRRFISTRLSMISGILTKKYNRKGSKPYHHHQS